MQDLTWLEVALMTLGCAVSIATPFLILYARNAARAVAHLADVTLTDEQLRQVDHWVTLAISFVEEQARKRAKGLPATAMQQTSEEKRALAIKVARDLAPDDLKDFTDRKLEMVVDAKVQDRRVSLAPAARPSLPAPPLALSEDAITMRARKL